LGACRGEVGIQYPWENLNSFTNTILGEWKVHILVL
jgi:hypothetical protein